MNQTVLKLSDVCKSFFGVEVLHHIDLDLKQGEVLGLVGENGAGKSTLMNIIGGVLQRDSGKMELFGEEYIPETPRSATNKGIAFIHQELSLFTNLSVVENLFVDDYPKGFARGIKMKEMRKNAQQYLDQYHLEGCAPDTKVESLPMGTRQMIEILKALVKQAKILIFDEPTTSLSSREKDLLFQTIRELKASGISIIYISHILEDVLELSDRISVLRDGNVVGTGEASQFTKEEMIKMMVGRDLNQVYPVVEKKIGEELFSIEHVSCAGFVKDVSITLREGEVVGLFGLMGAGRSEVVRAAFGVDPMERGKIVVRGKTIRRPTPERCIQNGMAFITENRREEGLMMPKMVWENLAMVITKDLVKKCGVVDAKKEKKITDQAILDMGIRAANPATQTANSLSGGNQQKVVIGKWVVSNPKIFLVDEPTRGIDVGAKYEIYKLILNLAAEGAAVLFISSEMEELMGVCDRIVVMKRGVVAGSLVKEEFSQESIMTLAL